MSTVGVMAGGPPTGTVTFLFTDIVGSTRLWKEHPDEMGAALERHDDAVRGEIESRGGYVFSTMGDGFAAAFDRIADAVAVAHAIGAALESVGTDAAPIRARIGLHVGEAQERDGDYFGPAVIRSARIMSVAHGAQVVASDALAGHLEASQLTDLGEHLLKDLEGPQRLWQLGGGDFPALSSIAGFRHNLPAQRTELVGRDGDVVEVSRLVGEHRLVTLLGIGGTGKTRLATAVGTEILHRFSDGVWFVDLVPATSAGQVVEAIVRATGLPVRGRHPIEGLAAALGNRQLLLLLDNCEHITAEVAEVVDVLLESTAAPRILATSREPLELPDERQVHVDPLSVSPEASSPAVRLFAAAAERVGVELGDAEVPALADIAQHLDGLPLSIELAAAQLRQLTLTELSDRLSQRFEILAQRRPGRHRRQASLLGVLDDTWSMLDEQERTLLLSLAAFPSRFDVSGVEGVAASFDVGVPALTLAGLIDRSLVARIDDSQYRLLETVKLFACRRWEPDQRRFEEGHTGWFLDHLASHSTEDRYVSHELSGWVHRHHDDRLAVESRLAEQHRYGEMADLYAACTYAAGYDSGLRAMGLIDRVEGYLGRLDLTPTEAAPLHLAAAYSGLPARRPDWFERGSSFAIEQYRVGDQNEALATALTVASFDVTLDLEQALALLDESRVVADDAGAAIVAGVAVSYSALLQAIYGDRSRAAGMIPEIEARAGTDPSRADATSVVEGVKFVVYVLDDPEMALATVRSSDSAQHWTWALCGVCATAAIGDAAATQAAVADTEARIRMFHSDDGLPDLLIPLAILAWRTGDTDRSARWVTAVRRAPRPTSNFLITGAYRRIRERVGVTEENPLDSNTIEGVYREAKEWLRSLTDG